jgi:hypothetical protein
LLYGRITSDKRGPERKIDKILELGNRKWRVST